MVLDGTPLQDRQGNPLEFSRGFVDNGNSSLINNGEKLVLE